MTTAAATTRPKRKRWTMRTSRRWVQVAFLLLFLWLISVTVFPLRSAVPPDLFLRADPLVALTAMLASRTWLPDAALYSSVIVVGTLLFGRFFCGWVCPMGTAIDLSDRYLIHKKREQGESRARNLKYYLLGGLAVAALFSSQLTYLLDPISLITRTVIWVLVPVFTLAGHWVQGQSWVYDVAPGIVQSRLITEISPHFRMGLVAAVLFAGILALGLVSRRYWCRNLCPLGALLALLSRWGLVRRTVSDDACTGCTACDRSCKMGAIKADPKHYQATECIYCFNCVEVCAPRGTGFPIRLGKQQFHTELDLSRRRLLGAAAGGLLFAALAKGDPGSKRSGNTQIRVSSPGLIRPPGSAPEDEFLDLCTRCGLCMKACPTNGLQPAIAEAGLEGFWTPVLVPRIGYCSQHCTLCGQTCPTDAIREFSAAEKKYLYIGTAFIDRSTCLVWANDKHCLVCDEVCSYRALHWKVVDGRRRPFVDEGKCTGCGECETKCPIQPVAAIRVASLGDKRHLPRERQRAIFEAAERAAKSRPPSEGAPTPERPSPYGGQ